MLRHPLRSSSPRCFITFFTLSAAFTLLALSGRVHAQSHFEESRSLLGTTGAVGDSNLPSSPAAPAPPPPPFGILVRKHVETSLSLGAFAQLTPTRLQNNQDYYTNTLVNTQTQGIAPTAGVLGTFRQQFSPWLGY